MKKSIINKNEINNKILESIFHNYPLFIGYGAIYLYLSFYFVKEKNFLLLLKNQNINLFNGEEFLKKLKKYKLITVKQVNDYDQEIIVNKPIFGKYTFEQFQDLIFTNHIPLQTNLSYLKYDQEIIYFFNEITNQKISPEILFKINAIMISLPNISNQLFNIALEKTIEKCSQFNFKYFHKICLSFDKLNINSIDKAELYLKEKFFNNNVDQTDSFNLLDEEIKKMNNNDK